MTWPREGSRETDEGIIISECLDWCFCKGGAIAGYRLTAKQREATNMADSVRPTDDRTHVKDSIILRCEGDGKADAGVKSHTIEGACWPKTWSESVTAEGRNIVRHDDEWWMNNGNTWGRLFYTKDMSQDEAPTPQTITPSMTNPTAAAAPSSGLSSQELPANADQFEAFSDGGATKWLLRRAPLVGPLNDYFGDIRPAAPPDESERERQRKYPPPNKPPPPGARYSGQCPCDKIVGSYSKMQGACSMLCGKNSQAHHIWGDKHFRTGSEYSKPFRIQMPKGSAAAPTRGKGIAICLDGDAAVQGTQHNTAHGSDALIQAMSKNAPTLGTLDFFTLTSLTTQAAINARPDCRAEIIRASEAAAEGISPDAPLRATNDPLVPDSPADLLLRPRGGAE